MTSDFNCAVEELIAANADFTAQRLSPVEHRDAREAALGKALLALAREHGVQLQQPVQINANGEYSLVAMPADGRDVRLGAGSFGTLAAVLNRHRPRTGVSAGAVLPPENGWCWMSHFDVEEMVLTEYGPAAIKETAPSTRGRRNQP